MFSIFVLNICYFLIKIVRKLVVLFKKRSKIGVFSWLFCFFDVWFAFRNQHLWISMKNLRFWCQMTQNPFKIVNFWVNVNFLWKKRRKFQILTKKVGPMASSGRRVVVVLYFFQLTLRSCNPPLSAALLRWPPSAGIVID